MRRVRTLIAVGLLAGFVPVPAIGADRVSFNRDVRPILAEHCWPCHGPDAAAREANLRLDLRSAAIAPAESGKSAIVPHQPSRSELIRRITANDPADRMPPVEFNRPLSAGQTAVLTKWIAAGATYEQHWAFQPLVKPPVPKIAGVSHPIDAFVQARLRKVQRTLAQRASPDTLLRRLSLTLTGLPPAAHAGIGSQVDRRQPANERSYDRAVDQLLASPHFGERMAIPWLDAARYADTNGYFGDRPRQMWLWRDWVIAAFNRNLPFDQFTLEQLAGDLLPDATTQQRIATGFNRNHMANNETGIIDEEYRVEYVVDRVDTTMTTWLALTAGCSQCHDHKFDPISQREFYQLFAFFNNVPERGLITADDPPPRITVATAEQRRRQAELSRAAVDTAAAFKKLRPRLDAEITKWEARVELPVRPLAKSLVLHESFNDTLGETLRFRGGAKVFKPGVHGRAAAFAGSRYVEASLQRFAADNPWTIGFWIKPDGALSCLVSKIEPRGRRRGWEVLWQKGHLGVHLVDQWGVQTTEVATRSPIAARQWHHVVVRYDGSRTAAGLRILVDGRAVEVAVRRDTLVGSIACDQPLRIGRRDSGLGYAGLLDELRLFARAVPDAEVADWFRTERLRGILSTARDSRSARDREFLLNDYLQRHDNPVARAARARMQQTRRELQRFQATVPTTLVMRELDPPRTTRVLSRGQYDRPGETVRPGVPAAINPFPTAAPRNRLGLAQWLIADENPLTARVAVNRLWQVCFGEGLVRTMNDFGTRGETPSHPDLLDWLAVTFRESGWDVKALLRRIVTSRTFQQDSRRRHDMSFDPENRLLGRGPSYRLPAEMIRDQALVAGGLLERRIGGPSVKPFQPPGLWEAVSYNAGESYQPDRGAGRWRRTVYTYIKRQAPPPAFLAFDGAAREKCTVQRSRTNTPLQALVLLNDPTYVAAARDLAGWILRSPGSSRRRLDRLVRRALGRGAVDAELTALGGLLERRRQYYRTDPAAAGRLLAVEATENHNSHDPVEWAAWTIVAQTVLNLDEAINLR